MSLTDEHKQELARLRDEVRFWQTKGIAEDCINRTFPMHQSFFEWQPRKNSFEVTVYFRDATGKKFRCNFEVPHGETTGTIDFIVNKAYRTRGASAAGYVQP